MNNEIIENDSGIEINNDNPYTFPIIHIGERNKVTVLARTMKEYSVIHCQECDEYFVALKNHPKDSNGKCICIHCVTKEKNV